MSSVRKRPDGKWRARYRDEAGKEHARHFDRKADAEDWLADQTVAKRTGALVEPKRGRITLAAFFAEWSTRQVWATGTARAMDLAMRDCTFADYPLERIRHSHVQSWVKAMDARLAPGTIKTRFNNVRSVVRAAILDRRITVDPMANVKLPRVRRTEHAMTIPTPEQVGKMLELADERFAPYIALCAFAGLRLGEASAVQLGDIEFMQRKLRVRRQVQRAGGGAVEITPPKYGSERDVSLPDELLTMLARHVENGVVGRERWLFGTGTPPHQNTVGYAYRKITKSLGLEHFTLHDLRHFYASGLIAAGCDVVTVQRALGHAKATTTLNTYSHLWPTAEDRTRAAASELMKQSLNPAQMEARHELQS
jgi:integrase